MADNTNAGILAGSTLLEDNECADGLTLAHGAMGAIMNGCPGANRQRVTKQMADAVNA